MRMLHQQQYEWKSARYLERPQLKYSGVQVMGQRLIKYVDSFLYFLFCFSMFVQTGDAFVYIRTL